MSFTAWSGRQGGPDMAEAYILGVTLLIAAMGPVSIGAAIFLWRLHAEDRAVDTRVPVPLLRLSLVLASEATVSAAGAVYLAAAIVLRLLGHPLPAGLLPVTVTILLALEIVPVLSAVYLRWLRRRRGRNGGVRPPPWSPDD